jgi:hypothetical protein
MILTSLALLAAQAVAPCPAGLNAVAADGADVPLTLSKAAPRKLGVSGAILFGKMKVKSVWTGATATARVAGPRPTFRLCATAPVEGVGDYVGVDAAPTSAADLRLIRFVQGKDRRELPVGSLGGFGGGKDKIGEAAVPVAVERIGPGITIIHPARDLEPGQYGFLRQGGPGTAVGKGAIDAAYDFTVE